MNVIRICIIILAAIGIHASDIASNVDDQVRFQTESLQSDLHNIVDQTLLEPVTDDNQTVMEESGENAGNQSTNKYAYNFTDTEGSTLVFMMLRKYPMKINLHKKVLKKDDEYPIWLDFGSDLLDSVPTSISATLDKADNSTGQTITATLVFTDMVSKKNCTLDVTDATLVFTFEMGAAPTAAGYWNMSQASIDIKYLNNSVWTNLHTNITPSKFGYTERRADQACSTGYGVCAPHGLFWSCKNQQLSPNILKVPTGSFSAFLSLPGLTLFPFPGNKTLSSTSVYNWDCDPLIPISLWISLIISLGLTMIVGWALAMLSYLPTPDRWDDPKKPGIYIPQQD